MIVERSMHEQYLSNAYLVADHINGCAFFIDSGAPIEPLLDAVERMNLKPACLFSTHDHHDHTIHDVDLVERYDLKHVSQDDLQGGEEFHVGDLQITALATPGHTRQHFAYLVKHVDGGQHAVFTGDVLFKDAVGGTASCGPEGFDQLRHSIIDVLLSLDDDTIVYPGHSDATTIGAERRSNPFIKAWIENGTSDQTTETRRATMHGAPCDVIMIGPDYDGGTKAWVRFDENHKHAIVGGSQIVLA